ncbi:MAG: CHAT domain-containing protein [Acaryochloris sp. CRU_2_0]|nr:CHAT domain-containing protein [Acaryochloris sp. CRU_2_0]
MECLSDCDGDRRATLGMAGVAAQVGARSTLASLWLVDDASTAKLMASFYENLQGGKTKAEALQAAQISLITSEENRHPFFWASFLLIGSWA